MLCALGIRFKLLCYSNPLDGELYFVKWRVDEDRVGVRGELDLGKVCFELRYVCLDFNLRELLVVVSGFDNRHDLLRGSLACCLLSYFFDLHSDADFLGLFNLLLLLGLLWLVLLFLGL